VVEVQLNLKNEPSEQEIKKFWSEWEFKKKLTIFAMAQKEIRVRVKDNFEVSGVLMGIDRFGNLWLDIDSNLEIGFIQRKDYQVVFIKKEREWNEKEI